MATAAAAAADTRLIDQTASWLSQALTSSTHQCSTNQPIIYKPNKSVYTARWLPCVMRPSRIITDYYKKTKHFWWWQVFDDMCRKDWWSFWSWFDVHQSTFDEDMHEKRFLHFRSQCSWLLTFRPQICSGRYCCRQLWLQWPQWPLWSLTPMTVDLWPQWPLWPLTPVTVDLWP